MTPIETTAKKATGTGAPPMSTFTSAGSGEDDGDDRGER